MIDDPVEIVTELDGQEYKIEFKFTIQILKETEEFDGF